MSFPVTWHPGPPGCPRDSCNLAWYTWHLARKQLSSLSWFKLQLAHFVTTRDFPRSLGSLLQATPRGFPIPTKGVLQSQDPIAFPCQHFVAFHPITQASCVVGEKVNSLKHSDGSPLFPRLMSRDLHHSCNPLPGHIISLLKLTHACTTLQCLTLTHLSHTCVCSLEVLVVPDL